MATSCSLEVVEPEKTSQLVVDIVNLYKTKSLIINIVNIEKRMICVEFLGTLGSRVSKFEPRECHYEMALVSELTSCYV